MATDKYPVQPEWMTKYMKSGKDLEKQLQDTVINQEAQWAPGDISSDWHYPDQD